MANQSFKKNTQIKLFKAAVRYNFLLSKLVLLDLKIIRKKYKLRFYKNNFLHLTGVKTKLNPDKFFEKCLSKTLSSSEFDCNSSRRLINLSRTKLNKLIYINDYFCKELYVQENFTKGKVRCIVATSDGKCTIGFTNDMDNARPITILSNNRLDKTKPIYKIKPKIYKILNR